MHQPINLVGKIFFNRYLIGTCIGYGSFGQVYLAYDTECEQIYAIKVEEQRTKNPLLIHQAKILKNLSGEKGFVNFHHFGYQNKHNLLVMGLLGPSLEDLFNACNRTFSLKTILMLAQQIINRLQVLHSKNYVYRDIKPQNFLMGLHENSYIVHLVDFGLSKKYRDHKNHQHVAYRQNKSITGTVRYSPINTHLGLDYSRRDDLQSLGYMLQYFYKGSLPWQGLRANTNAQKYAKILYQKQNTPIQVQFSDMPVEFCTFMHYCRSLKFADRPDYVFIRRLFSDLMDKLGYKKDYIYDWCQLKHSIKLENQNISLAIRNRFSDLQSPYVTFVSHNSLNQEEIRLQIQKKQSLDQVREDEQDHPEPEPEENLTENNTNNPPASEDFNEGNIDPDILEDSDLKLISNRNKWFDSEL